MVHEKRQPLRRWELALLMGLALALLMGTWLSGEQSALADKMVRLHVVGASDDVEDQMVKLRVRDAVLTQAEPWLEGVSDQEEAVEILIQHLPELAEIGSQAAGGTVSVRAEVEQNAWFPTKRYSDFALPAGRYTALKIVLGEGQGRNWWCVVFPPLCMGSVSETVAEQAGNFSQDQVSLVTGEDEGYVVKFKAMELWQEFVCRLTPEGKP